MPRFEGYVPDKELPVKAGDLVTIPKGTAIRTTRPTKDRTGYIRKVAGRTYQVRVHHVLNGTHHSEDEWCTNPSVRWPGSGGYWYEVDVNDVPEVVQKLAQAEASE